ncbi:flagellar biosynthetic protein FliR [Herbaspirillum sp. RTI4]|uniref:flagellar biosynthetic protein FliR n=1 Tax=Herbaspirillum sp. RTI4 TaxID=3048640 RepID=UPI002AB3C279|nr:flagellar biosynthetic protein FliR [Herbaspirillum sp. RTI4]MDY7578307.1 flagellar biosynthetic protein FliR [Herbaspirillum sp. RTI4]MEA9981200.1 flagellar biosynthetic protein FliR [Herbaspirillum sp. RTI4]
MISVTTAQLYAWVAAFVWPLTRILGLLALAPPFGNSTVPMQVKLLLGVALTLIISPTIASFPAIEPGSMAGLLIMAQQFLIGLSMGMAMRIVFAAVEGAGEMISSTMGLGFAVFFDPSTQGRTSAISQVIALLATLVFLSINGHLVLLATLANSFQTLPISAAPVTAEGFHQLALWGGLVFSMGLQLSLPVLVALLITNMALGILTRAAPQLNLFGVGFPITLSAGFTLIALALPYMITPLEHFLQSGIEMVRMLGSVPPIVFKP